MKRIIGLVLIVVLCIMMTSPLWGEDKVLTMSTTTSTQSSGLLDVLLPEFAKDTGIRVKVIAKGTGAAIRDGMDGNVDVIFVHAVEREKEFVEKGYGTQRYAVMHNDFVVIGPEKDPAGIGGISDVTTVFAKIAEAKSEFVSRGDDSGTHTKEQEIWKAADLPLGTRKMELVSGGKKRTIQFDYPQNSEGWYISIGQGMGKAITFAEEKRAYTLADRGTFIKYKYGKTPAVDLEILCEGDPMLANPYGVIPVNPAKHPSVRYDLAKIFAEWLVSSKGQSVIEGYQLHGKQLFFPDAM